jgi:putative DNA primase/helicase
VVETIHADRGRLVAAALTILRAWHAAGGPSSADPYGSFEDWSRRVREPLIWLGRADPCLSVATVQDNDPARSALASVLEQWKEEIGINSRRTIQQAINAALINSNFHSALVAVAGNQSGVLVSSDRLGRWLHKIEGKIVNGLSLVRDGNEHGHWLWKLQSY